MPKRARTGAGAAQGCSACPILAAPAAAGSAEQCGGAPNFQAGRATGLCGSWAPASLECLPNTHASGTTASPKITKTAGKLPLSWKCFAVPRKVRIYSVELRCARPPDQSHLCCC